MAKQIEPYEEDDFLLEDQQNSEEQTIEEEDEAEEESSFKLRPRPARASLTHNAIKSELLKMKKQDSGDDNEENLSRSARKRKKRREKVLEERRASGGRGDNFEDDLAHFKSIPISRRRSSVLPLNQTISLPSNHHNNGDGICSQIKCCLWIVLVVATLIGLIYVWPTVAELDYEIAEQLATPEQQHELPPDQVASNEVDEGDRIIDTLNQMNIELGDNQEATENPENQETDEEALGTFDYISSFFATEEPPTGEATEQQDDAGQNEEANDSNGQLNEENAQENVETGTADDEQADEGFDEPTTDDSEPINLDEEEILSSQVPERYQSAVHQDNLEEEEEVNGCMIGGQTYSNLNEEQCSLLQRQLEEQIRQQAAAMNQEQQQANENNEEQFYFF